MSDEEKPAGSGASQLILAAGLPPPGTPVAFADGVTNLAHSNNVVKFYLYRTDPDVSNAGPAKNNIVGQIVMPIDGFIRTLLFLNTGIDMLVANGAITTTELDKIKSEQ
jgi:hypothetical protein